MPTWLQVLGTIGAAVIGGIIAPQITRLAERRLARAALLEKIREVEALRWGDLGYQEFLRAIASLEAAAIIARIPRRLVRAYVDAAMNARRNSRDTGDPTLGWYVDNEVNKGVEVALEDVSRYLWHPILGRVRMHRPTSKEAGPGC